MPSAEGGEASDRWPDRWIRPHRDRALRLGLRNLYILPTRFGWLWLLTCAVLYLMGISASSNGALLLAYGGLGLFLLAPFLTQFNLQGLELRCGEPSGGYAGQPLAYPLEISSRIERNRLHARFQHQSHSWCGDLAAGLTRLTIPWTCEHRGVQRPGRLRLESTYPLGLFICWTLWHPQKPQLVYPGRRSGPVGQLEWDPRTPSTQTGPLDPAHGSELWRDLTPHRPEEGSGRIAWKHLARTGIRLSKQFADQKPRALLLCPAADQPPERALEHLCDGLHRLHDAGLSFGVVIGDLALPPSSGNRHLRRCLEALALAVVP